MGIGLARVARLHGIASFIKTSRAVSTQSAWFILYTLLPPRGDRTTHVRIFVAANVVVSLLLAYCQNVTFTWCKRTAQL